MAHYRTTPRGHYLAYQLRHHLTEEEEKLWVSIRDHRLANVHFRRQHAIGKFIVDFCAPRVKLVIELDGSHHVEQQEYDAERTAFLQSRGYIVLRFSNEEINRDINAVIQRIIAALPPPRPSPKK